MCIATCERQRDKESNFTSHRRLHSSLHHARQQLQALGVLSQARGKGGQRVCMATQVLKGNTLSEVCLQQKTKADISVSIALSIHIQANIRHTA